MAFRLLEPIARCGVELQRPRPPNPPLTGMVAEPPRSGRLDTNTGVGWLDNDLRAWLEPRRSLQGGYRHAMLTEKADQRLSGLEALAEATARAHEDAKRLLGDLFGTSLDPLEADPVATAYPAQLNTLTLQGYLGEIFAGLYAENYAPHGLAWEVPAFLFRFSNAAIEGLERRLQLGGEATRTPGRTGDDCVAFYREESGAISAWLNCEAKCTTTYPRKLIADGHRQLGRPLVSPVSLYQLIQILSDSEDPDSHRWVAALRVFRVESRTHDGPVRADLFLCVCGRAPTHEASWLDACRPDVHYTASQPLEAVEVHLDDLDGVLMKVYPGHEINRA